VFGGFVALDTEVTKSSNPCFVGRGVANIPTMQFSLLSKYKLTEKLSIGGQAIYASETPHGLFAISDTGYTLPSHWRFDAMAEFKLSDSLSVQLNVVNLTDELYYDAFYRSNAPFMFVAPGRAGYLTLNWKY
jgi:catecholate siderophore receptor